MTNEQIKHMVDRFLGWKLPANFTPDGGISFKAIGNEGTPYAYPQNPSGTNLFDAKQADAMVRYMLEGMPTRQAMTRAQVEVDMRMEILTLVLAGNVVAHRVEPGDYISQAQECLIDKVMKLLEGSK